MKNKIYQTLRPWRTFQMAPSSCPPAPGDVGLPRSLLAALNRQGAKNLTGISNNAKQWTPKWIWVPW